MSETNLVVIPPDPKRHADDMVDLVAKVFGGYFQMRNNFRDDLKTRRYDWAASRIGIAGDRLVTHWGVIDWRMRIGSARVRVGVVGVVATHGDFRKRGFMAETALASIAAMRRLGYDMTLLFGIGDFYHRFGYVPAWPEATWTVAVSDLPAERPKARLRRLRARDIEAINRIYNRESAGRTGTAVRSAGGRRRLPDHWQGFGWERAAGSLSGYVLLTVENERLVWRESGGAVDEVLRALAWIGRRHGCREVRFDTLHYESALCERLRRLNSRLEQHYVKNGGAMVRIINLAQTLEKMAGELERRLRASRLANWQGRLTIAEPREQATLAIDRPKVKVIKVQGPRGRRGPRAGRTRHAIRGGDEIARLLSGSDEPQEVIEGGKMRLSGDARRLAAVLFPNEHPMLSAWDRF